MALKMIAVFFLGFANGIPLTLIISTLNAWLAEVGISNSTIGIFTILVFPYTFKFLWAPFLDYYSLPILSKKFGQKRSWLFVTQFLLSLSIIILGLSNPVLNIYRLWFCALAVAFFAAIQEVIVDSYRIHILSDEEQGVGSSSVLFGYKIGVMVAGGIALFFVDYLCKVYNFCNNFSNWSIVYSSVAFFIMPASIVVIFLGEPQKPKLTKQKKAAYF